MNKTFDPPLDSSLLFPFILHPSSFILSEEGGFAMAGARNGLAEYGAPARNGADCVSDVRAMRYRNQALRLSSEGKYSEAEIAWRESLCLKPDDVEVLNELGLAIWRQGRAAEAEPIYRQAWQMKPHDYRFISNLGLAVYDQGRIEEAGEYYRLAIEIEPDAFDALVNLGLVLSDLGKFDEANEYLDAAYRLRPNSAPVFQNYGINLVRQGRLAEAIEKYEHGLRLEPDLFRLHMNLGYALLTAGDYERGWLEHEWRLKWRGYLGSRVDRSLWNGEDLRGRTILLHTIDGLGDTLQFIRFAPLVKARGGFVMVCCQTRLLRMVARCAGVDLAFDGTSVKPDCDCHAPLMSLPAIFGTTLATIPNRVPYLATDPMLVDHWRVELARSIGIDGNALATAPSRPGSGRPGRPFLIGIVWQGNPRHTADRWRSIPLAKFAPLAELPGVRLISLQTDDGLDQIAPLAGRLRSPIVELSGRRGRDFTETAAIVSHLDLIIAPDSSVSHLAGGLGVPVWVALSSFGDWRWLADRDDSPWYPTARLFRQTKLGDWDNVFRRMTDALAERIKEWDVNNFPICSRIHGASTSSLTP
jgi:tetratricopeptide (TPR) repeat protein